MHPRRAASWTLTLGTCIGDMSASLAVARVSRLNKGFLSAHFPSHSGRGTPPVAGPRINPLSVAIALSLRLSCAIPVVLGSASSHFVLFTCSRLPPRDNYLSCLNSLCIGAVQAHYQGQP